MGKQPAKKRRFRPRDEAMEDAAERAASILLSKGIDTGDVEDALSDFLGSVISKVLEGEMAVHMGYDKGGAPV